MSYIGLSSVGRGIGEAINKYLLRLETIWLDRTDIEDFGIA